MGISVKNLDFGYADSRVLHNISLQAAEGRFTVLLGKNGSGKSTLIKLMAGLLPFKTGYIEVFGRDIRKLTSSERASLIGYLSQFHSPAFPFLVEEVVLTGRASYVFTLPGREDLKKTDEAIDKVGINHLRRRPYTELSGGERQLVMIARVLAQEPQMILLDEPLSHLDLANQARFLTLVKDLVAKGLTVVAVLHDPNTAFFYADDFLFMKDGFIIEPEKNKDPWDPSTLTEVYGTKIDAVPFRGRSLVIPI